ncbi:DUF4097 and DUF4098 domain-containing protein YvlB [Spinactinospora alkalitolerans]|uniref:DUF4097 and DUF4098 domain-containing protein YvlB n=1 Tax=Spinactinospora alkalitolerans TaxID=687207 RepID=A0A852TRH5_9ACTN|nr:DUF4097 family beta strand repeat-containing protein [Spinactinospora alkalitolerans]NYE45283.1 DUF4097 and DUF4098 domain-containing protein YvlB [Spinactinospora alkalitolerans]
MTFTGRGLYASSSKVPRKRRFGWLFIGALVAVLALGYGMFSVLGGLPTAQGERSDEYERPARVVVENGTAGDVNVHGVDGGEVRVERELHGSLITDPSEAIRGNGEALRVEAECEGAFLFFGNCAVDYEIGVPEGTEVAVRTSTGDIEVSSVRGDVAAASLTGDIALDNVEGNLDLDGQTGDISAHGSGDRAEARTTTGEINLEDFAATEVDAESTTGSVNLEGGFSEAAVRTTTGEIHIETADAFERITADSTTGQIGIRVPENEEYHVTGDSTTGERDIDVPTDSGAATRIDATTTTGAVNIRPD